MSNALLAKQAKIANLSYFCGENECCTTLLTDKLHEKCFAKFKEAMQARPRNFLTCDTIRGVDGVVIIKLCSSAVIDLIRGEWQKSLCA